MIYLENKSIRFQHFVSFDVQIGINSEDKISKLVFTV
jgi:hypothetical protein